MGISCDYIEFSIIIYIHSIEKTRKYDILSLKSAIAEFNSAFCEIDKLAIGVNDMAVSYKKLWKMLQWQSSVRMKTLRQMFW